MGGGASTETASTRFEQDDYASDHPGRRGAIQVRGAINLKDTDGMLQGTSDPYVVCRLGSKTDDWDQKTGGRRERRSKTCDGTVNPVWNLAFPYVIPEGESPETFELHLRIYDDDLLSADDFLGEARITIASLVEHTDESREYNLRSKGGSEWSSKDGSRGAVIVMEGDRVEQALVEAAQKELDDTDDEGWGYLRLHSAASSLGQYFRDSFAAPTFYANLLQFALLSASKSGALLGKFRKNEAAGRSNWPDPEGEVINSHAEVTERLKKYGDMCGTTEGDARWSRFNVLGFMPLNGEMSPELGYRTALGITVEDHAWIRPILTQMCGPSSRRWSHRMVKERCEHFFAGRKQINVPHDLKVFNTQLLHKIFFDFDWTEEEGAAFMELQGKILIINGLPSSAAKNSAVRSKLGIDAALEAKGAYLQAYAKAIPALYPDLVQGLTEEKLTKLASAACDALMFAGGQSVPSLLLYTIALPFSDFFAEGEFTKDLDLTPEVVPAYVLEVMRRFPMVSGFAYREISAGNEPDKTIWLNVQAAQADPAVWGGTGLEFRLRPLADYHRHSLAFVDAALAPRQSELRRSYAPASPPYIQL